MGNNKVSKNYKKSTFILLGVLAVGIFIVAMTTSELSSPFDDRFSSIEELMCNNIRGTPGWANYNGMILGYGVKTFDEEKRTVDKNLLVESLIDDRIYYLYNPDCPYCQQQAEWFGEEAYSKYKESGYAVDCTQYW